MCNPNSAVRHWTRSSTTFFYKITGREGGLTVYWRLSSVTDESNEFILFFLVPDWVRTSSTHMNLPLLFFLAVNRLSTLLLFRLFRCARCQFFSILLIFLSFTFSWLIYHVSISFFGAWKLLFKVANSTTSRRKRGE